MASARALKSATEFGKEVGKEVGKLVLDVAKEVAKQKLEEKYHGTQSEEAKRALKAAINTIGAVRSAKSGTRQHMIGQYRKDVASRMMSLIKEGSNKENSHNKVHILPKHISSSIVPYHKYTRQSLLKHDSSCDALYANNHGDYYICKNEDPTKCTYIHSTKVGELETIANAHKDCLKQSLPFHARKCKTKKLRDLPHGYAIYDCPEEQEKMQGGRLTRRGRRSRRYTRKRGLKK